MNYDVLLLVMYLFIPIVYTYFLFCVRHILDPPVKNNVAALSKRKEYEDGPALAPFK